MKQIQQGIIRFSPSKPYIELEKRQHKKGRGNFLEGKVKFSCVKQTLKNFDTGETIFFDFPGDIILTINGVDQIPIFCCSHYDEEIKHAENGESYLELSQRQKDTIYRDFENPEFALIFFNPTEFIQNVRLVVPSLVVDDIKYFDYEKNELQRLKFIMNIENEKIKPKKHYLMNDDIKYRVLFCKDNDFQNQNEFRFLLRDMKITERIFIHCNPIKNSVIVRTEQLLSGFTFSMQE